MTTELTQKLENIISGHSINEDDADWLRALTAAQPAQVHASRTCPDACKSPEKCCNFGCQKAHQPAQAGERGVVLPAGWVPLTIEHEPGYPEEVAFGPQRMMDRLKKWLDKHFAALAAQPAQAGEVAQAEFNRAIDFAIREGIGAAIFLDAWRHGDTSEWPEFEANQDAPEPVLFNGLTEAETNASASVMGLAATPTQPAAQATPDVPETDFGNMATPEPVHYIGAHITEGKLHASVMRRDSGGIVTVVATAEMHAGSLHELDCMSKMKPATPEPVQPFFVRDVAALLGVSVPDVCKALAHLGHGQRSTNMVISPDEALAVAEHIRPATPEPVGEPDTVPLDALHAAERERDYWKTRARAMLDHAEGTCWYWMGDGEDHLESLVNSLPVVIRADQLRELLARPAPGVPEGWTDEQCLKFMCVALRHVEYKRGTKGPSCDDIRLGLKFALAAAQAKGDAHD